MPNSPGFFFFGLNRVHIDAAAAFENTVDCQFALSCSLVTEKSNATALTWQIDPYDNTLIASSCLFRADLFLRLKEITSWF